MILPNPPQEIQSVISRWPASAQLRFHDIRQIVFEVAAEHPKVGPLTEALKWGEPSFLTLETGSGTTLRVCWKDKSPVDIGLFVICRTDLLDQIRSLYPGAFRYEGTRAAYLSLSSPVPRDAIAYLAMRAQTHHL